MKTCLALLIAITGTSALPLHGQALPELPMCVSQQGAFTSSYSATGEWGLTIGSFRESGPLWFGDDDYRDSPLWDIDTTIFDPNDHSNVESFLEARLSHAAVQDWTRAVLTVQCTDIEGHRWNVQYEATRQTHKLLFGRLVPSDTAFTLERKSAAIIE